MSQKRTAVIGGALSAFLVGGIAFAPIVAAQDAVDSAFGVAADGVVTIPPTPYVEGSGSESLVDVSLPDPATGLVEASALNVEASEGYALANVADAAVNAGPLPAVSATAVEAECDNLTGTTTIADLMIGDQAINVDDIPPNTEVIPAPLAGIASVTLNKQVTGEGSLTVTAISINLLESGQTVDIASATCTEAPAEEPPGEPTTPPGDDDGDDGDDGDGDAPGDGGAAPVPTPEEAHLEVTG